MMITAMLMFAAGQIDGGQRQMTCNMVDAKRHMTSFVVAVDPAAVGDKLLSVVKQPDQGLAVSNAAIIDSGLRLTFTATIAGRTFDAAIAANFRPGAPGSMGGKLYIREDEGTAKGLTWAVGLCGSLPPVASSTSMLPPGKGGTACYGVTPSAKPFAFYIAQPAPGSVVLSSDDLPSWKANPLQLKRGTAVGGPGVTPVMVILESTNPPGSSVLVFVDPDVAGEARSQTIDFSVIFNDPSVAGAVAHCGYFADRPPPPK